MPPRLLHRVAPGSAGRPLPKPDGLPIFGDVIPFARNPLKFFQDLAPKGDVIQFADVPVDAFLFLHPDQVRDVLITFNRNLQPGPGNAWLRRVLGDGLLTNEVHASHLAHRRLVQPAFHRERINGYARSMITAAEATARQWEHGQDLDAGHAMMEVTLRIVSKTLLDVDVEDEIAQIGAAVDVANGHVTARMLNPIGPLFQRLPLPSNRRFDEAVGYLDEFVYRIVDERRASGVDAGDLISELLLARDEDGNHAMTRQEVRDEAMTLFLAGHETTANALTWTWYLLATNPEAEAALHQELDQVLDGRLPTMEDLPRLSWTANVVSEALRLYPPAWGIARSAHTPFRLDGIDIERGATLVVSQYLTQRDGRWFRDPDLFRPQRWTEGFRAALPRFAYFPFGGGPKQCIGERFAWIEAVLVLATLARAWRFRLDPDQEIDVNPQITLRPRHGMRMFAERRR